MDNSTGVNDTFLERSIEYITGTTITDENWILRLFITIMGYLTHPFYSFYCLNGTVQVIISTVLFILTIFILEVAGNVKHWQNRKPSTIIQAFSAFIRPIFYNYAYVVVIFADIIGFFKRTALWIRKTFFHYIPEEAVIAAYNSLKAGFGDLLRSPSELIRGMYDSIRDSTVPWFSAFTFCVGVVVFSITVETILYSMDFNSRPSTVIAWIAESFYNTFWQFGNVLTFFWDLKELGVRIATWLFKKFFGWIPIEKVKISANNLSTGAWRLMTSLTGFFDGLEVGLSRYTQYGIIFSMFGIFIALKLAGITMMDIVRYCKNGLNYCKSGLDSCTRSINDCCKDDSVDNLMEHLGRNGTNNNNNNDNGGDDDNGNNNNTNGRDKKERYAPRAEKGDDARETGDDRTVGNNNGRKRKMSGSGTGAGAGAGAGTGTGVGVGTHGNGKKSTQELM